MLLGTILAMLLLVRLGLASLVYSHPELAHANDTDRYVPIANGLLAGTAYTWDTQRPGELLNTVGYPLFLAAVYSVFGHDAGDVALAQLLMTGLIALFMYVALSRWLGASAFFSALILLLDPLTSLWSMTILTEALFAATLAIAAVMVGFWANTRNQVVLLAAGLFTGLACLVRPIGLLIVLAWAAALMFLPPSAGMRARPIRYRLQVLAVFLLPPLILIAPWYARNALLWNCLSLSSVDRVTVRDYVAAKMIVETEHVTLEEAQGRLQASDPGVCPRDTRKYWSMVLADPAIYVRLHLGGTFAVLFATNFDRWLQYFGTAYTLPDLWRPYMDGGWRGLLSVLAREVQLFPQGIGLMIALTVFQVVVYVLALLGAYVMLHWGSGPVRWYAWALAIAIIILVVTPGQSGHERFRVPLQPLFAILAGYWAARRSIILSPGKVRHNEALDI